MHKLLVTVLCVCTMVGTGAQAEEPTAKVSKITEDDLLVIEVSDGVFKNTENIFVFDVNDDDGVIYLGDEIPVSKCEGSFYHSLDVRNAYGSEEIVYQFRSDDNEVWWILTEEEIGHIPNVNEKYVLYYTDNGTGEATQVCDCLPEWDCECYLYDDIFLGIYKTGVL